MGTTVIEELDSAKAVNGFEKKVEEILRRLTPQEEQVLRLRFGIGARAFGLEVLGQRLGVSNRWVRRLEARALRNLRVSASASHTGPQGPGAVPGERRAHRRSPAPTGCARGHPCRRQAP